MHMHMSMFMLIINKKTIKQNLIATLENILKFRLFIANNTNVNDEYQEFFCNQLIATTEFY